MPSYSPVLGLSNFQEKKTLWLVLISEFVTTFPFVFIKSCQVKKYLLDTTIMYSWRTKCLKIQTVEQNFFEGQSNHRRHLIIKLHPVFSNLRMRTSCNLAGFIDNYYLQRNRPWKRLLQPESGSDEQICACPSCRLQLYVAKKFLSNGGFNDIHVAYMFQEQPESRIFFQWKHISWQWAWWTYTHDKFSSGFWS